MEFNFKSYEQIAAEVANRALDEFEFNGKTIRAWAETLTCPKTNADRIRAMSDQELAELFARGECGYCRIHDFCAAQENGLNCEASWLDWLSQEAEEVKG